MNASLTRVVLVRVVLVSQRCELPPMSMGMLSFTAVFAAYATASRVVPREFVRTEAVSQGPRFNVEHVLIHPV